MGDSSKRGERPSAAFDADAYCDAASAAVGIEIPEICKPGIAQNLERIHEFARLVLEFPGLRSVEPAARFDPREQRSMNVPE